VRSEGHSHLRRTVRVDQQLVTLAGETPVLGPTKTPSSVRTVPVPQVVLDVLARHVEQYTPEGSELLFLDEKGDPSAATRSAAPGGEQQPQQGLTGSRRTICGTTRPR
jgi:hypothetical protein